MSSSAFEVINKMIHDNQNKMSDFPKRLFIKENLEKLNEYVEEKYPKCELIRQQLASEFNYLKMQLSNPTQHSNLIDILKLCNWKVITLEVLDSINIFLDGAITIKQSYYQNLHKEIDCQRDVNENFKENLSLLSFRAFHTGVIGALSSLKNELHQKEFSELNKAPAERYKDYEKCIEGMKKITFEDELNLGLSYQESKSYNDKENMISQEERILLAVDGIVEDRVFRMHYESKNLSFTDGKAEFSLDITSVFIYCRIGQETRKITKEKQTSFTYVDSIEQGPSFESTYKIYLISPEGAMELSENKVKQIKRL